MVIVLESRQKNKDFLDGSYKDVRKELDLSLQITRTNNLDVY